MRKVSTGLLGALLLVGLAILPAAAAQYPPTCTDSITIWNIQNPAAPCHPVGASSNGDTVWVGLTGIVIARDTKPSGVGFWMEMEGGGPYTGIDVFTGNTGWPLAIGDKVIVRPSMVMEYGGETELVSLTGSWGTNLSVTKVASGQPTPIVNGTTTDWNTLPSNTFAEQYEGQLAMLNPRGGRLRVARTYSSAFMVVDSACTTGICDSVYVDITTIPNPSLGVPPLGTGLNWIRGVIGQTANGYRIRMRDDNDWYPSVNPPVLAYAYCVAPDSVLIRLDKQVTQASAENVANYSLLSGGLVNGAVLQPNGSSVKISITNGLGTSTKETINVSGLVAVVNNLTMAGVQSRTFWNGITPIAEIQAPDPDSLAGPHVDRSRMAGVGSAVGDRLSYRGVCTAVFPEGLNYIQDLSGATRTGLATYATVAPLTVGHQYLVVATVQEYFGETESTGNVYLRDEGPAAIPAPVVQTVAVLQDTTCDVTQSYLSGEDYEGMLVKMKYVRATNHALNGGDGFGVAGPFPTYVDSIHVRNVKSVTGWTYQADSSMTLDVTGVETFSFGTFQVAPRTNADFVNHGLNVGVPPGSIAKVSFSAYPNPGRVTQVNFTLPRTDDVDLSVFDLAGRRVATLARGTMAAGVYNRSWNSAGAGAGVYFVRLKVGSETYNIRTVSLK